MPRGRPRGRIRAPSTRRRTSAAAAAVDDAQDAGSPPQTPHDDQKSSPAADDSDTAPLPSAKSTPPPPPQIPRKRRPGRPPKNRPPDWDSPRVEESRGSDTPRRKRGRPAGSGFRGRPRYAASSYPTRVKVDKEGTMMDVVNDEVDLPEDPEGEEKVDKSGNLLGGREYRVRTFTVRNRGDRLYMLSTEPARCCGFRDSYLFFAKHMQLHKVIVEEDEKRDLIERDIIPHSYKGRSIGVVTARSVFREFGARIIVGGRKVLDDYHPQAARERGDVEGELADPNDKLPSGGEPYNKNQYVAWHGASAVYHTQAPAAASLPGKAAPKRKVQITSANWQIEHARAASRFNSQLAAQRKATEDGVYDPHTNVMHLPSITQPTHAKWEAVTGGEAVDISHGVTTLANRIKHVDLNRDSNGSMFEHVPRIVSRNFLVVDTTFTGPPMSGLGNPGPDGDMMDIGPGGLPDADSEVLTELPPECRKALMEAKETEARWKQRWGTEEEDGSRGVLKIGFMGFPV